MTTASILKILLEVAGVMIGSYLGTWFGNRRGK